MQILRILAIAVALLWPTAALAGKTTIRHSDGYITFISSTNSAGSEITHTDAKGQVVWRRTSPQQGRNGHLALIQKYKRPGSNVSTQWE